MNKLEERAAQLHALTQDQRDEMDDSNPIIYAESGPNRFQSITLFFPEEDGVRVEEDLDLHEITVHYFTTDGKDIKLEEGHPIHDWALDFYRND